MAYLAVLFLVAMMSLAATAAMLVWSVEGRREKEQDLLFVGSEFAKALNEYRRHRPNASQPYPTELEQLLADERASQVVRELRRIYVDPITGRVDWVLVRNRGGGIVALYSPSGQRPIRTAGFPADLDSFATARSYRDWVFKAAGASLAEAAPTTAPIAQPQALSESPPSPITDNPPDTNAGPAPVVNPRPRRGSDPLNAQLGTVDGCNTILATDLAVCAGQGARFGGEVANECTASAMARNGQCLAGGPLEPLYFRSR
jgi:type II secretory pathway pseudopilin PulG